MTVLIVCALMSCRGGHAVQDATVERGGHAITTLQPIPRYKHWICIHNGEAAWNADTGNGYHGGLQMDWNFMRTYGADMLRRHGGVGAESWTPREQMTVANRAWKTRGFGPWPQTRIPCGV